MDLPWASASSHQPSREQRGFEAGILSAGLKGSSTAIYMVCTKYVSVQHTKYRVINTVTMTTMTVVNNGQGMRRGGGAMGMRILYCIFVVARPACVAATCISHVCFKFSVRPSREAQGCKSRVRVRARLGLAKREGGTIIGQVLSTGRPNSRPELAGGRETVCKNWQRLGRQNVPVCQSTGCRLPTATKRGRQGRPAPPAQLATVSDQLSGGLHMPDLCEELPVRAGPVTSWLMAGGAPHQK